MTFHYLSAKKPIWEFPPNRHSLATYSQTAVIMGFPYEITQIPGSGRVSWCHPGAILVSSWCHPDALIFLIMLSEPPKWHPHGGGALFCHLSTAKRENAGHIKV